MIKSDPSALKTWAMVLAFLAALMLVLGSVAYVMGRMAHANNKGLAPAQSEARH